MVRSPAAPSPFRFSGLLFADSDSGGPMLTSASPGRGGGDHDGACRAQRGTGSSTTDRKICSTNRGRRLPSRAQRCGRRTERSSKRSSEFGGVDRVRCPLARANGWAARCRPSCGVDRVRCPLARANGWAARCRPSCSTCSGRLGGAAAAGRTMVRSPAAPSPVRFSGLLFADSGADDGARAVGATDDDVGFAWSARWRRRDLRGRSINDGKFSSTDMVRLASLA